MSDAREMIRQRIPAACVIIAGIALIYVSVRIRYVMIFGVIPGVLAIVLGGIRLIWTAEQIGQGRPRAGGKRPAAGAEGEEAAKPEAADQAGQGRQEPSET